VGRADLVGRGGGREHQALIRSHVVTVLRFVVVTILLATAAVAIARDFSPDVNREAAKVFGEVMSPFCPGKLIADCPSPAAMELREEIKERIAGGASAADIRQELYTTYGEKVRAAPTMEGFDVAAWLVPPVVVVVGAAALLVWIRRRRVDSGGVEAGPAKLDAKSKALIEAELAKDSPPD
jgi:cytochrome c-type biogenesis protein CcmH